MNDQQPNLVWQNLAVIHFRYPPHVALKLVQFFIQQFHNMESIENLFCLRQVFHDGGVVHTQHVRRHRFDLRSRCTQPFTEGISCVNPFTCTNAHYSAGPQVDHNRETLVPPANADFIDDDDLQISQTRLSGCLLQRCLVDAANHSFTDSDRSNNLTNRHYLPQIPKPSAGRSLCGCFSERRTGAQRAAHARVFGEFQSHCFDTQHGPMHTNSTFANNAIDLTAMNHLPAPALGASMARGRRRQMQMKNTFFSPKGQCFTASNTNCFVQFLSGQLVSPDETD